MDNHLNRKVLENFGKDSLPDLDVTVLGALELLTRASLPHLPLDQITYPLVVGSGNAASVGKIIFEESEAVFATESDYLDRLQAHSGIETGVVISASGGKHSVEIAKSFKEKGLSTFLLTNTKDSKASQFIPEGQTILFPKNREPYTYNTSTYLSMILAKTGENAQDIKNFIEIEINPLLPKNLEQFDSYFFLLPAELEHLGEMIATKFEELFGPQIGVRVHTIEDAKHATTITSSKKELFVSLGVENELFGEKSQRLSLPLPSESSYGGGLSLSYYFIGQIQKANPPYFKDNIENYVSESSRIFGEEINIIVE